jgi:hypothetical protein
VSVLGALPQGLPTFAIPWIAYREIVPVLIGGGAVAGSPPDAMGRQKAFESMTTFGAR